MDGPESCCIHLNKLVSTIKRKYALRPFFASTNAFLPIKGNLKQPVKSLRPLYFLSAWFIGLERKKVVIHQALTRNRRKKRYNFLRSSHEGIGRK
jgi:hypothetical protein